MPVRWPPPRVREHPVGSFFPPLNEPFLKVNVDASWLPTNDRGCSAVIISDHRGYFVATRKLAVSALGVAFVEALALLLGYELAIELGYECVTFESDSL
ncbi:hypothetical protein FF1_040938 [Malus domestica]